MIKNILSIFIVAFACICFATSCAAGWLIFSKPAYSGRIIDAETKEPIEGAVVVAIYQKHPIIGGPAGSSASIIHIKEALTDKNGEFSIPSYATPMSPNSYSLEPDFIIYKPGYSSYPNNRRDIYPFKYCGPGILFSKQKMGIQGEIHRGSDVVKITYGVLELPRLKTKEERLRAIPSTPTIEKKDTPLLYNAINEENKHFGLGSVGR
jgi:hypothetical protein